MSGVPGVRIAFALGVILPASTMAQVIDMQDMPGMPMSHRVDSTPSAASTSVGHDHHDSPAPQLQSVPPNDHVAPAPPQYLMQDMAPAQMASTMQMDDSAPLGMLMLDRLERSRSTVGDLATNWEAQAWWGNAMDRLWLKTEGERGRDGSDGRLDVLWSHAWTSFWDWQLGARQDFGQGPQRQWAAVGVQGLAPYWFETQATFYVGGQGRTALRLESSYELLFTQRLILQPRLEMNFYGKDDPQRGVTSGLSDLEAGLRLRYEISRKFAPYLGVEWTRRFGEQDATEARPLPARETTWVAGVRLWF